MLHYKVEPVVTLIDEINQLSELHYDEVSTHKHIKKLDPDWDQFRDMEIMGVARFFTARDHGRLVGYFITLTGPHLHFKTCTMAHCDAVYLHPHYRPLNAVRFFEAAINDLRENTKADILSIHMKLHVPFRGLLTKLGAEQTEENWELEL